MIFRKLLLRFVGYVKVVLRWLVSAMSNPAVKFALRAGTLRYAARPLPTRWEAQ
jgi:hypothetical protein